MDQHLRTTVESEGMPPGHARLKLRGQFTWLHGKQFRIDLERVMRNGFLQIELDLTELSYVDSTALSEILSAHKLIEEANGRMWIVNPRKLIRHIFVSAKLDQVLDIGPAQDSNSSSSNV